MLLKDNIHRLLGIIEFLTGGKVMINGMRFMAALVLGVCSQILKQFLNVHGNKPHACCETLCMQWHAALRTLYVYKINLEGYSNLTGSNFLLYCPFYNEERNALKLGFFLVVKNIDFNKLDLTQKIEILFNYGDLEFLAFFSKHVFLCMKKRKEFISK